MVSAVPLSSATSSAGFDQDSFETPAAAHPTLIALTETNARTAPPSRNRSGFFIYLPLAPMQGFRCCPETACPARTCSQSGVGEDCWDYAASPALIASG